MGFASTHQAEVRLAGSKGRWEEKLTPGQVLQGDTVNQEEGGELQEDVEKVACVTAAAEAVHSQWEGTDGRRMAAASLPSRRTGLSASEPVPQRSAQQHWGNVTNLTGWRAPRVHFQRFITPGGGLHNCFNIC